MWQSPGFDLATREGLTPKTPPRWPSSPSPPVCRTSMEGGYWRKGSRSCFHFVYWFDYFHILGPLFFH